MMKIRCLMVLAIMIAGTSFLSAQGPDSARATDLLETLACEAGNDLYIPIRVTHADATALQFDLEYDPEVLIFKESSAAAALTEAGKTLRVNHIRQGLAQVVVFGANLTTLPQGEIGGIVLQALSSQPATPVRAKRRALPNALGHNLVSVVRNGHIIALSKEVSHADK